MSDTCISLVTSDQIERVRVINKNTIAVNLDALPTLPFLGATVSANSGRGWVTVQKRRNSLYQDGVKIVFHLDQRQKYAKSITGRELLEILAGHNMIHPNVFDEAVKHNLMPSGFRFDESHLTRSILSLAVLYANSKGIEYICYWRWDIDLRKWGKHVIWFDGGLYKDSPVAMLES